MLFEPIQTFLNIHPPLRVMAKNSFLLLNLQEDKAKAVAKVISNESCRKMLEHLAEKEATSTELSIKLQLPLPTVHYNLKHLQDAGLVVSEEFHYSAKGKEVNHYKLANKYIIIAPKAVPGIKERLKSILPASVITIVGAGVVHLLSRVSSFGAQPGTLGGVEKAAITSRVMESSADKSIEAALPVVEETVQAAAQGPSIALWFLIGAFAAIFVFLVIEWLRGKRKDN